MWIEELKNGKYKFVERYTDYLTGKSKKVSVTLDKNTASSRKIALEMLNKKIQNNFPVNVKNITLKDLIEKYRAYQKQTVKPSTYKRNYYASDTLMRILGEDTLINRLSSSYIVEQFLATGKEPGTLNEHLTRFKAIIRWGFQNDYIDNISFIDKIPRFKDVTAREKIKDKYLEPDEVTSLLSAIEKTGLWYWYYLTKFLILSGLRSGEAIALTNDDIDLKDRVIHVTKTYDSNNKIITTPKTACSIRDVFIQDELFTLIKKIMRYMKELKLAKGTRNNYFMVDTNGNVMNYAVYEKFLRNICKKVISKKVTAHTLRHTHASLLLAEGISVDTISRRLGHENSKITREIYLHITNKLKQKDNESIRNINII